MYWKFILKSLTLTCDTFIRIKTVLCIYALSNIPQENTTPSQAVDKFLPHCQQQSRFQTQGPMKTLPTNTTL